ncbi:MAG: hypothetical protein D6B26_02035 [Spirochaetaceae bacterium]|nr:MAG: hypothetical protein D6B26_02035 [Spirochaetaceae bacterium]
MAGIGMAVLTAYSILLIRDIREPGLFLELLFVVVFSAGLVLFVVIPFAVYILGRRKNPAVFLFSIMPPVLAALVSGNHMFSLATLMRTGRQNQGVSRKAESVVFSLTTLLCRAGTAMVVMIAFIVVLRSYSSLEISIAQVLLVALSAIFISFVIGGIPGGDMLLFLGLLSGLHSRGIPEGYLILLPLIPLLLRIGAALDVAVAAGIAQVVGYQEHLCKNVAPHDFL